MKSKSCFIIFLIGLGVMVLSNSALSGVTNSDSFSSLNMTYPQILIAQAQTSTQKGQEVEDQFVDEDDDFLEEFENTTPEASVADPLYYLNYSMYAVNDFLYYAAIKPIATGYKFITPDFFRIGVNNFFHNLLFPVRFVNNVLQFEFKDAGSEVGIFVINTTVGILGFGQVAQNQFDMYTANEDLGQTLGAYSIGNGFYLVLPVLGPSTLRDTVGLVGDSFLTPVNYVEPWELSLGIKVYDAINSTSLRLGDYEALTGAALDPYVAIRNAYVQNRLKKVNE